MIKKILTTKAHLVVLFLGLLFLWKTPFWYGVGTWDLSGAMWGWTLYEVFSIGVIFWFWWIFLIPLVYWGMKRIKLDFYLSLLAIHIFIILLLVFFSFFSILDYQMLLLFLNWAVFFVNIFTSIFKKRNMSSSNF